MVEFLLAQNSKLKGAKQLKNEYAKYKRVKWPWCKGEAQGSETTDMPMICECVAQSQRKQSYFNASNQRKAQWSKVTE